MDNRGQVKMNDEVEPLTPENEKKMNDNLDKFLEASRELGELMRDERLRHESKVDSWWNNLSEQDREFAFYAVCKRIFEGDLKDNGSYRHVLYQTFGFDPGMYARGMDCGYMAIHNCLFDGEELVKMKSVNRFEVIDETGRAYTKYLKDNEGIKYSLQDEDKTLKVFIDKETWKEDL